MGVSFIPHEESNPVPCPGFEGFEKRLEVDFWDPLGFADPAGLRAIPRSELDAMLSAAECTVVAVLSNSRFDSYVLSESSLFVYPSKIVLKTCGTTQLLKAIPPLLASALHVQLQACRCKYTRGSFIFPSSQPSPYGNFSEEVVVLERYFGHLGGGGRAYVLGEPSGMHNWHVYTAAEEVAPPAAGEERSFTLEMCMTQLERSAAAVFYKSPFYRSAGDMTLLSGIRGLLPHSEICDFAFDPCGYSMNSLQGGAHSTIHVTPEDGFSYASFETQGYNPRMVDLGSLVERVLACFRPGVFSVSVSASGDARWQDAGSWGAPVAPRGYVCSGSSRREMPGGSLVVYHTYSWLPGGDAPVTPLPLFSTLEKAAAGGKKMMFKELHLQEKKVVPGTAVEVIGPCVQDMDEFMRWRISSSGREEAFYVLDLAAVTRLYKLWRCAMPRVHPFYAVKCNPDPELLALLAELGAGFDVASKAELEAVSGLGLGSDRVVFANPCKLPSHLTAAAGAGVLYTTFDCEGEVAKVKKFHPDAKLLLRLRADDTGARCPLGVKYGALLDECMGLLEVAMAAGVEVAGVAFHVGSGASEDGVAFAEGIRCARRVFDMAERLGMGRLRVLDIGGGFVSEGGSGSNFSSAAYHINRALEEWFPEEMEVRIIAEPGRYFAEEAMSLAALVFGCRRRNKVAEYWINDGIYGSMNCLLYDHASLSVRPLRVASLNECMGEEEEEEEEVQDSVIFGPTCDGLDTVLSSALLPRLECGDWLVFPRMGAYTKAAASTFNGFSVPSTTFYVHSGVPSV